ncbi:uncharacterized protein LOC142595293 [Pelecanus crispus]|uniref:uncharacterized protein LOC142595293 n=1 Tax=Pelecanus crispus TaxID=36300 RepID=UPI003F5D03E0
MSSHPYGCNQEDNNYVPTTWQSDIRMIVVCLFCGHCSTKEEDEEKEDEQEEQKGLRTHLVPKEMEARGADERASDAPFKYRDERLQCIPGLILLYCGKVFSRLQVLPGKTTAKNPRSTSTFPFALEVSLLENYCPRAVTVGLRRCGCSIKAGPSPHSLTRSSCLHLLGNKVHLQPQDMSCYNPCLPCPPCGPCGPTPLANSCNEPCVRQCQDSTVVIQPSPVVVTLPGPILTSFPQSTAVGSSTSAAVGSILSSAGVPINSGGSGLSVFGLSGIGSCYRGRPCLPC